MNLCPVCFKLLMSLLFSLKQIWVVNLNSLSRNNNRLKIKSKKKNLFLFSSKSLYAFLINFRIFYTRLYLYNTSKQCDLWRRSCPPRRQRTQSCGPRACWAAPPSAAARARTSPPPTGTGCPPKWQRVGLVLFIYLLSIYLMSYHCKKR